LCVIPNYPLRQETFCLRRNNEPVLTPHRKKWRT